MMTAMHFVFVAAVLKGRLDAETQHRVAIVNLCYAFADAFQHENPRFDRWKFLEACGVNS